MGLVIQGQITKVDRSTYSVRTDNGENVLVTANSKTVNNGLPSVGEYVVSVIEENSNAKLMTRYIYNEFQAA